MLWGAEIAPETVTSGATLGPSAEDEKAAASSVIRDEQYADREECYDYFRAIHLAKGHQVPDISPGFGDCAEIYRQLRRRCEYAGDYRRVGEFFFREMHCTGRQMAVYEKPIGSRALWWVLETIAGYGEWPTRMAVCAGLLVVGFAVLYRALGLVEGVPQAVIDEGIGKGRSPHRLWLIRCLCCLASVLHFRRFLYSPYFSVIVFTTLGYGELRLREGWGRFLAVAEVVLVFRGLSLLLVCLVRKFSFYERRALRTVAEHQRVNRTGVVVKGPKVVVASRKDSHRASKPCGREVHLEALFGNLMRPPGRRVRD
ncbi:MAG: potassium channel family protein [Armatimonadetes bacterium]|nr:potassium channel family protein [Armatimonadota bacterium]